MTRLWRDEIQTTIDDVRKFDALAWGEALSENEGSENTLSAQSEFLKAQIGGEPMHDLFQSLYKRVPNIKENLLDDLRPVADLVRKAQDAPHYQSLRHDTIGDSALAGFGAYTLAKTVWQTLPNEVKEHMQGVRHDGNVLNELLEHLDTQQAMRDTLEENFQDTSQHDAIIDKLEQDVKDVKEMLANTVSDYRDVMESKDAQITLAINNAVSEAQEESSELASFVKGFSEAAGGTPGQTSPQDFAGAMKAMQANPKLKDFSDILGWAKKMTRGEWRKSPKGKTKPTGYKTAELNPATMAASEFMAMTGSLGQVQQLDWTTRASEDRVLHRSFEGEQESGRGDIVYIRDESGSMSTEDWQTATALEWALLEIARREKRGFIGCPFSGLGLFNLWHAPDAGQPDVDGLLAHLTRQYHGGTEPYGPLKAAIEHINETGAKADIVLVTDGAFAEPSEDFLKLVGDNPEIKIYTISLYSQNISASRFSKVINVRSLFDEREKLREVVGAIV